MTRHKSNTLCFTHILMVLVLLGGCRVRARSVQNIRHETSASADHTAETIWPPETAETKPWTRWWWHGAAVDKKNLTRLMEIYDKAGLGGVEVTSIYGVKGREDQNIHYLSPQWLEMLDHVIAEADRLGMGVDLPPGCGWRIGGSYMPEGLTGAVLKIEALQDSTQFQADIEPFDEMVKRAGPGGRGKAFNPFISASFQAVVDHFSPHFKNLGIRAQFHDSWEYYSNSCPDFFEQFISHRGYDIRDHLPALAGKGEKELADRVRYDVQLVLADLALKNFILPWTEWCREMGSLSRNQGHGSPGNPLDFYSAADIPETEIFGMAEGDVPLLFKLASSAAHVEGKKFVAAETAVWMREHFNGSLADIKQLADRYFVSGINHLFYHGTAYSPEDAPWPGWLFYASTQVNPQNTIWRDLKTLNTYLTRCQSILQDGAPANDLLIYLPIHDVFMDKDLELAPKIGMDGHWFRGLEARETIEALWKRGYSFDYISDAQILKSRLTNEGIEVKGGIYKAILIPPCRFMPAETLQKLSELSETSEAVIFASCLSKDVPGLSNLKERQNQFQSLISAFKADKKFEPALKRAGVRRESAADNMGLRFIRKRHYAGHYYFVVNDSEENFDSFIALAFPGRGALLMDAMNGNAGLAAVHPKDPGKYRLQLDAGASVILKTFENQVIAYPNWKYNEIPGKAVELRGKWRVDFIKGGPVLPESYETTVLSSWTANGPDAEAFSGTARYSLKFDSPMPSMKEQNWLLDLGSVHNSARASLNGDTLGTLIGPVYRIRLGQLKAKDNLLEIEVTNLAANRIRDLDRKKIPWRIFEDINFVNRRYEEFDASDWGVLPSGLIGPVMLHPLK